MSDHEMNAKQMYHVSKAGGAEGETLGPWSIEEIAERLAKTEIAITDFVYDEKREDWITLVEFDTLKEHLRRAKPKAPPKASVAQAMPAVVMEMVPAEPVMAAAPAEQPATAVAPTETVTAIASRGPNGEWFVQKGTERHGPFSYLSLIRALQDKSVYEFDFVWTEGMETWTRLAEHEAFKAEKIREMSQDQSAQTIFAQRAHPRVRFDSEVIVHDDRSAWIGRAYEGSVGGSGLVIENAALYPGQTIRLHFSPAQGLPAFNVVGEIVNKKFVKSVRGVKSPVQYAVRFLQMDENAKERVNEYFSKSAA